MERRRRRRWCVIAPNRVAPPRPARGLALAGRVYLACDGLSPGRPRDGDARDRCRRPQFMRLRVWRELSRRAQRCAAAHTPDSWASLVDAMPCVLREDKIFGSLEVSKSDTKRVELRISPEKKKNSSNLSSMFLKKEGFERDFFFFGNSCASKGA